MFGLSKTDLALKYFSFVIQLLIIESIISVLFALLLQDPEIHVPILEWVLLLVWSFVIMFVKFISLIRVIIVFGQGAVGLLPADIVWAEGAIIIWEAAYAFLMLFFIILYPIFAILDGILYPFLNTLLFLSMALDGFFIVPVDYANLNDWLCPPYGSTLWYLHNMGNINSSLKKVVLVMTYGVTAGSHHGIAGSNLLWRKLIKYPYLSTSERKQVWTIMKETEWDR